MIKEQRPGSALFATFFFFFVKQQPGYLPDSVSPTPFATCPSSAPWFHHHLLPCEKKRKRGSSLYSTTLSLLDKCIQWWRTEEVLEGVLGQVISKAIWRQEPFSTTCPRWLWFGPCSECIEQHKKAKYLSSGLHRFWITTRSWGHKSAVLSERSLVFLNFLPKLFAKFALQMTIAKTIGL